MGAPCSTAPPGSPPLTGGSLAETWSGRSSAGVCFQVWGSGYTVSGGLVRTGLCQASPLRCSSPAQPPSLIGQDRTPVDQSHRSWARGRGWGRVHFRQVFLAPRRAARVRDRGQMGKFFSFIFLEKPLVLGRDRKIEGGLVWTHVLPCLWQPANICLRKLYSKSHCHL